MAARHAPTRGAPPPPSFVLRGHGGGVTHADFVYTSSSRHAEQQQQQQQQQEEEEEEEDTCIISGDEDGELRVWSVALRRPLASLKAHSSTAGVQSVRAVSCGAEGVELVSQGRDNAMKVHRVRPDGSHETAAMKRRDAVYVDREYSFCKMSQVAASSDGQKMMIAAPHAADGRRAVILDARSGEEVIAVPHAPSSSSLTSSSTTEAYDAMSGDGTAGQMMGVQLHSSSSAPAMLLLSCYEDGSLHCWDARQCAVPVCHLKLSDEPLLCADVASMSTAADTAIDGSGNCGRTDSNRRSSSAADGARLRGIAAGAGVGVHAITLGGFDTAQNQGSTSMAPTLRRIGGFHLRQSGAGGVAVRGLDARVAAVGCWDSSVRLYDLKRQRPLAILRYHTAQVTSVAFAPCDHRLVSSSRDGSIAVWDVFSPGAEQGRQHTGNKTRECGGESGDGDHGCKKKDANR